MSGRSNNRDRRETGIHGRVAKEIEGMLSFDASLLRPFVKALSGKTRTTWRRQVLYTRPEVAGASM